MKRWLPFLCVLLAAAAGGANVQEPEPPPAEKARRFHRNRELVEILVVGGLQLVKTDDPIERGDCFYKVVGRLDAEIRLAMRDRDGFRAAELSRHFRQLLEHGVAANLRDGRQQEVHPESAGYQKMLGYRNKTVEDCKKLEGVFEGELQQLNDPEALEELRQALEGLAVGRAAVAKSLPPGKDEKAAPNKD